MGPVEVGTEVIGAIGNRGIAFQERWGFGIGGKDARVGALGPEELGPQVVIRDKIGRIGGDGQERILMIILPAID